LTPPDTGSWALGTHPDRFIRFLFVDFVFAGLLFVRIVILIGFLV
jgi:hypothetical protein